MNADRHPSTAPGGPQLTADLILHLLRTLARLDDPRVTAGHALNQLDHALQTATRAERAGMDEEVIVAALCHDVGKLFAWQRHGAVAAEMLRPFVRPEVAWAVRVHEDFTPLVRARGGNDTARRRRHRWRRGYHLAAQFADEFDTPAVDRGYDTAPLTHFELRVRRVFARPRYQSAVSAKRRMASAAFAPVRPLLGRHADHVEDASLDWLASLYGGLRKRFFAAPSAPPDKEQGR